MKILDRVDISGSMNLASTAKDTFTIGTPLENNDGNVDNLIVHANADFKNNVILGSGSIDIITVNGRMSASHGIEISNSSLSITGSGTIYYNGMDVFASMGGGGGSQQSGGVNDIRSTGSGVPLVGNNASGTVYIKSLIAGVGMKVEGDQSSVSFSQSPPNYNYKNIFPNLNYTITPTNNAGDTTIYYADADTNYSSSIYLPDAVVFEGRIFIIKNITISDRNIMIFASGSQTIDGTNIYSLSSSHAITLHAISSSTGGKWYAIGYY